MTYNSIVISSGHGLHVRGASGIIDEVNEARKVVERIADELRNRDVNVVTYHDDVSKSQNENLQRIVDFHNSKQRDLDISVHFNAYVETDKPMGTECLYYSSSTLAGQISSAIASCGFINRGPKQRTDLYFLANTEEPAVLLEICFVDSTADADIYGSMFGEICDAIASALAGAEEDGIEPPDALFTATGKVSNFGGPDDEGVSADEALAFISDIDDAPQLFLPFQPAGTTGLARRLNPYIHYVACRWDYEETPRDMLRNEVAMVRAVKTGIAMTAFPADWGPAEWTERIADLSPGLMQDLGIKTDDEVEIVFPYRETTS